MSQGAKSKLLEFALSNELIAVAILGQAIIDEGGIGASGITIFYTDKGEAEQLWKIANFLGYANSFRKKRHRNHFHYGFSIKASKRKELYDQIGPLPNPTKDQVFRHLRKSILRGIAFFAVSKRRSQRKGVLRNQPATRTKK